MFSHKPVLLQECIESLMIKPDGVYIDGTIGGGGHSAEIYTRLSKDGLLIGMDQDESALEASRRRLAGINGQAKLILVRSNFENINAICLENGIEKVDGVLLDLGVSSHQLDQAERGFSYQKDAPLDMRMDRRNRINAEIIVNEFPEEDLRDIISRYGEERWASRIAAFIVASREKRRIKTTFELVDVIKAAIPASARKGGPHPAKRTFQAIRIAVNNELGVLKKVIGNAVDLLSTGGRFCIITFHSLEDRIVKNEFKYRAEPCTCPKDFPVCICGKKCEIRVITRKPILPTQEELKQNSRSRSAKLRVAEKV
ncbi:MAG: 16S rRNA (cytosine(1402)-N(4))-methyltransferase RsmH [Acetivibrionales bacterium]